jgi:hypothetical protein
MIMAQAQYRRWDNGDEAKVEEEDQAILARHDSFEVPRNGWWTIVFHNPYQDAAELEYDIATWPSD